MVTKKMIKKLYILLYKPFIEVRLYAMFLIQFIENKRKFSNRFLFNWGDRQPCLHERNLSTTFDKHYIYHTAWAARKLKDIYPEQHVDISSYTYFSTLISAFIPVKFFDYRPALIKLDNFSSEHTDITDLSFATNSISSLSCMHVVEHIGLGRYGDPIDENGDIKAISELKRVIAVNGILLFVVPIGSPKIMFNAHRIYSYDQIISYFSGFELKEFALIPDSSDETLIINATKKQADLQQYGCGCFCFQKVSG